MESTPWDPEGVKVALDRQGRLGDDVASSPSVNRQALYENLVVAREFDRRLAVAAPSWTPGLGEEAALAGLAMVSAANDWVYPGLRDASLALLRGVPPETIVRDVIEGRLVGYLEQCIGPGSDALGMQVAIAGGHALGLGRHGEGIVFASFGEGLTTTGAFHESLVTAAYTNAPLVLVCRSQQWPDGAPAEAGTVGDSVSERAQACGLWVRRVDGADPLGVHAAIEWAADRARRQKGPSLVEVVMTRLDRPSAPSHRDPIERLRRHLETEIGWLPARQAELEAELARRFDPIFESWVRVESKEG